MAYDKKFWKDGMVIDANSLNNMEEGIANLNGHEHKVLEMKLAGGDSDFIIHEKDGDFVIGERGYDPQGNNVYDKNNLVIPHTTGSIAINRDVDINGNVKIPPLCNFKTGDKTNDAYSGFEASRLVGGLNCEARYGVGSYGAKGYAQLDYRDTTNELDIKQSRLLLGESAFLPETNGKIDLGTDVNTFRNGHFKGSVFSYDGNIIREQSGFARLYFKSADNSRTYGTIGKVVGDSNDFIISPGLDVNVRLHSYGEGKAQLGTSGSGVESYQGSKAWYFAPYGSVSPLLGTAEKRFGVLYSTGTPNVSSDASVKTNISYVSNPSTVKTTSQNLSTADMYSFVKDDLRLAEFGYKNLKEDYSTIGFIAQDIQKSNSVIADKIITTDSNGLLGYDLGGYVSILAGALQEATNKIADLEARLIALESK